MRTAQLNLEGVNRADRLWHLRQTALLEGLGFDELNAVADVWSEEFYPGEQ